MKMVAVLMIVGASLTPAFAQARKGGLQDASYEACFKLCSERAAGRGVVGKQISGCATNCVKNRTERNAKRQKGGS
jgi:hypothetical protein